MTPLEAGKLMTTLFYLIASLMALAAGVALTRRYLEKKVEASMQAHVGSLVGKRAMVVSDLRAGRPGEIRPLGSTEEEVERASKTDTNDPGPASYPAVADQLISRGRVVRVTGGDDSGYLVRPL